jgi:hypothetical protein
VPAFILSALLITVSKQLRMNIVQAGLILSLVCLASPILANVYARSRAASNLLRQRSNSPIENAKRVYQSFVNLGNGPPSATYFTINEDQAAAVSYIRMHAAPNDRLFVGNGRHDITISNDVLFYFLAERNSVTKYQEFNAGLTNTAETQKAIIEALRVQRPLYVVKMTHFDTVSEPNASSVSSGVTLLDQFLECEYTEVARFGEYHISKRLD